MYQLPSEGIINIIGVEGQSNHFDEESLRAFSKIKNEFEISENRPLTCINIFYFSNVIRAQNPLPPPSISPRKSVSLIFCRIGRFAFSG
jgi:hypothetical protein